MKALFCIFAFALTAATAGSALAKTTSKTISATVTLVNGSTVSAYLTGGAVDTVVQRDGSRTSQPAGALPLVRIGFELPSSWYLVKHVTWDKQKSHLTIDF